MHVDTIRSIFKFDPYLTFIDPSRECPGISSGTPKLKMFNMYLGIQKHFQTFVPRNWSRDLQAGPLLHALPLLPLLLLTLDVWNIIYILISINITSWWNLNLDDPNYKTLELLYKKAITTIIIFDKSLAPFGKDFL